MENHKAPNERRGVIIVFSALLMVVIFGMAAFGIDLGYVTLTRTQLQVAADSGAMAAGGSMHLSVPEIIAKAKEYATMHVAGGRNLNDSEVDVELGTWDTEAKSFTPSASIGNAVRVTAKREDVAFFFGQILGTSSFDSEASAIAMANPRDIAFVVDLSGSMNDDTEPAWATPTIDGEFGPQGFPTAGTNLMDDLYDDFGFGTYPGTLEYVGAPLGVAPDKYAYAEMTKDNGPLSIAAFSDYYRIYPAYDELTRKERAYRWIIDNQIANVMPAALPVPDSTDSASYAYWEKYLDYIMQPVWIHSPIDYNDDDDDDDDDPPSDPGPSPPIGNWNRLKPTLLLPQASELTLATCMLQQSSLFRSATHASVIGMLSVLGDPGTPPVDRGWLPPWQDSDRIHKFNNPNYSTFPGADSNLPYSQRNKIGYLTYVQFMMDHGRDLKPDNSQYTPLSTDDSSCPYHSESTAGGTFSFPPRAQPMHAARRAIIAAIDVVDDRNETVPNEEDRDQVSIITFDVLSGGGPEIAQPLTGTYIDAMQACTMLQAVGDKAATTATEAGLDLAAQHLRPESEGGAGREKTDKVVVLLTDGVPNLYISTEKAIDNYMGANPSGDFFGGGYYWLDAPLMQASLMEAAGTDMFPVGIGLGTDGDFMNRMARMNGTANDDGQAPQGSGNPAEYEQTLIDIFENIIKRPTARLVE